MAEKNRRRWVVRGAVLGVVAAPLLAVGVAQAHAAELAPVAEVVDGTVAATSESVVDTIGAALGVED
ncbi:hypothetical protein GCM10023321_29620 [Pseudonocardia eucalypti]|uniref:Uncharacterized protein n=1 Tax=Pseudonocardia eucalypti TaxID=648755 RepID=A0ABP9Q256_9PSEU|nr:hypothetical protein [Pseudonocardia eucalypti]